MSIRPMEGNLNYHSSLPDQPPLTASELKHIWDQGVNDLKDYINDILIPDMIAEFLSKTGGTLEQNLVVNGNLQDKGTSTLKRLICQELATFGSGVVINADNSNNGLEIYGSQPFIDFHFGNSSADYTTRVIEDTNKHLSVLAENGINLNFNPNALSFGDGAYASSDYWFVRNAHNGHHVVNTWQDRGVLELSIDNNSQGAFVLSNAENSVKTLWDGTNGVLNLKVDQTTIGTFTIQSASDERLKTDIKDIDENVLKAIGEVKLKQFKLIRNNPKNKISFGVIAQDLIKAFEKYGLNYKDYELISTIIYEDGIEYFIVDYEQFNFLRMAYIENKIGG